MIESGSPVEMEIPVVFKRHPFINLRIAPGLQTVLQTEADEILALNLIDIVKIIKFLVSNSRIGNQSIIDVWYRHMSQTVDFPKSIFRSLPRAIELRIGFQTEFGDETVARTAFVVVVLDFQILIRPRIDVIRIDDRIKVFDVNRPFRRSGVGSETTACARNQVDCIEKLDRIVEHVQSVEAE